MLTELYAVEHHEGHERDKQTGLGAIACGQRRGPHDHLSQRAASRADER